MNDATAIPKGLQGNIIRSHRRAYSMQLFLSFPTGQRSRSQVLRWMKSTSRQLVTTAASEEARSAGEPPKPFCSLLLSASGFRALKLTPPQDEAFLAGMKARGTLLSDPGPETWDTTYQRRIDALLMLAHNDTASLTAAVSSARTHLRNAQIRVVGEEMAWILSRAGRSIEHFGYVDGIENLSYPSTSMPQLRSSLLAPLGQSRSLGSFLVFRKLEQNVELWLTEIRRLARESGQTPALFGAYVVGRHQDGTPVLVSDEPLGSQSRGLEFQRDLLGTRCPYQSHVRSVHQQDSSFTSTRVIARRGMIYGNRPDLSVMAPAASPPSRGVGLLFMCYQSNIASQFEHLQIGANGGAGAQGVPDALIGQGPATERAMQWPVPYGTGEGLVDSFARTVSLKGGEYFYAPSTDYLENPI